MMGPDSNDPTTRGELRERLARVEEKQDHVVEKIDDVADTLDEDLGDLEESHEDTRQKTRKMWLGWQFMKYVGGPGGVVGAIALALL